MIIKKPIEELIKLELKQKEYLVRTKEKDSINKPTSYELLARGKKENIWYVASRRVHRFPKGETIDIDEEGIAFCRAKVGPIEVTYHDRLFLGNTSFACAMGRLHQERVFKIYQRIHDEEHPLLDNFLKEMEDIITKLPAMHEALQRRSYFGDTDEWDSLTPYEKRMFEYLTAKQLCYRPIEENNPENYDPHNVDLIDKQHADCIFGNTKEEACFLVWYNHYLKSRGYDEKIKESRTVFEAAMEAWLDRERASLEKKGFKKVKKFSCSNLRK